MTGTTVVAATVIRVASSDHEAPYVLAVVRTDATLKLLRLGGDVTPKVGSLLAIDAVDEDTQFSSQTCCQPRPTGAPHEERSCPHVSVPLPR